jgi:hypothetical protein
MSYGYGTSRLSYIGFIAGFAFELVCAALVIVLGFFLQLLEDCVSWAEGENGTEYSRWPRIMVSPNT